MERLPLYRRIIILATGIISKDDAKMFGFSASSALPEEVQIQIATQEALAAAIEMIGLQSEVWEDLSDTIRDMGIYVELEFSTARRLDEVAKRLEASLDVVKEPIGLEMDWNIE